MTDAVKTGKISQKLLTELLDLRRRHKNAKIPEVLRLLLEEGKANDPNIAKIALVIALDSCPGFGQCSKYDKLYNRALGKPDVDPHNRGAYWRGAYENPIEGQIVHHKQYGEMRAVNVGVFTMGLEA